MNFSLYKAFFVYKLEKNTKLASLLSFCMNEVTTRQLDHEYIVDDGT